MIDILREIGMIARALDSISNIEFKELSLTRGQYLYWSGSVKILGLSRKDRRTD